MNKSEFIQKLSSIKTATSVTGKKYHFLQVFGDNLNFVRQNKTKTEIISVTELFELFTYENSINTSIAKLYISGGVQSPAVAILNELKSLSADKGTTEVIAEIKPTPLIGNKKKMQSKRKEKDETRFFNALSELLGGDYLLSKNIGKPITSSHIFLSNNFESYFFNKEINDVYVLILRDLKSNCFFSSKSLSHNIDGAIMGHPILHNRIIEFDEEQHFTPARLATLAHLQKILPDNYFSKYRDICNEIDYLNDYVLKKHRVKKRLKNVSSSFEEFVEWLKRSNEKSSGYICNKNGFEFIGGRIAQRAYYDCLRDTAHLSKKNDGLGSPLRFAKKEFENIENKDFGLISMDRIKEIIVGILYNDYGITIPKE